MITKKRMPLLIAIICGLEVLIYLWSAWTSTFQSSNYFAIGPETIFDKCARLSGRISSVIMLISMLFVGYNGLKQIYRNEKKLDTFRVFITLFTFNHLIHFLFVFLRFKNNHATINIGENLQGFITFICIVTIPFILWTFKQLNWVLYLAIILHLFNVSYFMNKTFLSKISPEHPAYHNQFGIVVLTAACIFVLYSVYSDYKRNAVVGKV
ncbi:MAG: hypothetical protein ACOYMA_05240 [Bacteroidia bacterium]